MKKIVYLLLLIGSYAHAGEIFEKNGFAIDGYDPVSYFEEGGPQIGSEKITATHRGSVFKFTSEKHRLAFQKAPEKFVPQYDGFCAYGMAGGYKAKTDPNAYTVKDGKLYLNYDSSVQKKWAADREKFIEKADKNWPSAKSEKKIYW